jgi:hypothetical protein
MLTPHNSTCFGNERSEIPETTNYRTAPVSGMSEAKFPKQMLTPHNSTCFGNERSEIPETGAHSSLIIS